MVVPTIVAQRIRHPEKLRAAEDTDFAIRLSLAGCAFVMAPEPGAVWRDIHKADRVSDARAGDAPEILDWIESLRGEIPERAYYGCLGWPYARHLAQSNKLKALTAYLTALFKGCYAPRLAMIIALQILLPRGLYRLIADIGVRRFGAGLQLPRHRLARPEHTATSARRS
jgi:hypothetical protein